MISSRFLIVSYRATYIVYIIGSKRMIRHQGVLSLLGKLNNDPSALKTLGLTHLASSLFYLSSEKNIFFTMKILMGSSETPTIVLLFTYVLFIDTRGFSLMSFTFVI